MGESEEVNTEMVEEILSGNWHTVATTPAADPQSVVRVSPVTHYEIGRHVGVPKIFAKFTTEYIWT